MEQAQHKDSQILRESDETEDCIGSYAADSYYLVNNSVV